ncbi:non-specific serine/threonine protein kinase [Malassezia sp. CBS 17886]|nr:non-specific serine/threonine protein kinase [Malassezia sp. CBS 17886]
MPVLGSNTREINVYGRKRNTRVVNREVPDVKEGASAAVPPPAPRSLFSGLDLSNRIGAWIDSPRRALQQRLETPGRQKDATGGSAHVHRGRESDEENASPPLRDEDVFTDGTAGGEATATPPKQTTALAERPGRASYSPSSAHAHEPPRSSTPALESMTAAFGGLDVSAAAGDAGRDGALSSLLASIGQTAPTPFPTFLAGLVDADTQAEMQLCKIGEASYSEVFRVRRSKRIASVSVLKVIPLQAASGAVRGPAQSSMESVQREILISAALADLAGSTPESRFVPLQSAHIVQGAYPAVLLAPWDAFRAKHPARSENPRPGTFAVDCALTGDVFPDAQLYAVLVMEDAGIDAESAALTAWGQRAAVFWQAAYSIAHAERALRFEHRDLHLGNILVRAVDAGPGEDTHGAAAHAAETGACGGEPGGVNPTDDAEALPAALWRIHAPSAAGVQATVIDYSLSRLESCGDLRTGGTTPAMIHAYDFGDEDLFKGEGDSQYDVYRTMRGLVSHDWQGYYPGTNVLWLHFVAQRLLAMDEPPVDMNASYTSLLLAEQLAQDAVEQLRRSAPTRSVSTRSKRRSIQRGPDAWKLLPDTCARPVHTARDLIVEVAAAMQR